MAIFLGKNYLDQTDRAVTENAHVVALEEVEKRLREQIAALRDDELEALIAEAKKNPPVNFFPARHRAFRGHQRWDKQPALSETRHKLRSYSPSVKNECGSMCSGLISSISPTSCRKCGPRMHRQLVFGSLHAAGIRIGLRGLSFVTTV